VEFGLVMEYEVDSQKLKISSRYGKRCICVYDDICEFLLGLESGYLAELLQFTPNAQYLLPELNR
jgi:hypothetical protein